MPKIILPYKLLVRKSGKYEPPRGWGLGLGTGESQKKVQGWQMEHYNQTPKGDQFGRGAGFIWPLSEIKIKHKNHDNLW